MSGLFGSLPPFEIVSPYEPLVLLPPLKCGETKGWDSEMGVSGCWSVPAEEEGLSFEILLLLPTLPDPSASPASGARSSVKVCQNTLPSSVPNAKPRENK